MLEPTPARRLLVVTVNLQEAFRDPDVADPTELVNFARRVPSVLPYAPDVLLVQEITGAGSGFLADALSETTGSRYEVAVAADVESIRRKRRVKIATDTAVILNAAAMTLDDPGGFIQVSYDASDAPPGRKVRVTHQAFCRAHKNDGSLASALMSVHYVTSKHMVSPDVTFAYKGLWSRQLAKFLDDSYAPSGDQISIMAGDFNNRRCIAPVETVACNPMPFWRVLVEEFGYQDTVFAANGASDESLRRQYRKGTGYARSRIDYVFARAEVLEASHDVDYGAAEGDPDFYSDHRMVWALVESAGGLDLFEQPS